MITISIATLLLLLTLVRVALLMRVQAVPAGVVAILVWLAGSAASVGMGGGQPHVWGDVATLVLAAAGGCWLMYDWDQLGQGRVDLLHHQEVVRKMTEEGHRYDHTAGGGAGDVASMGADGPGDNT